MTDQPPQPPPGWYQDPSARYRLRYWGGDAWTEHVSDPRPPDVIGPRPPDGQPPFDKDLIIGVLCAIGAVLGFFYVFAAFWAGGLLSSLGDSSGAKQEGTAFFFGLIATVGLGYLSIRAFQRVKRRRDG
jgi:hypothetical protein